MFLKNYGMSILGLGVKMCLFIMYGCCLVM